MKKFGTILTSRESGKEALAAIQPALSNMQSGEKLVLDFEGVYSLAPSWGDEFLTALFETYHERLMLNHVTNSSVQLTLEMLEKTNGIRFQVQR